MSKPVTICHKTFSEAKAALSPNIGRMSQSENNLNWTVTRITAFISPCDDDKKFLSSILSDFTVAARLTLFILFFSCKSGASKREPLVYNEMPFIALGKTNLFEPRRHPFNGNIVLK